MRVKIKCDECGAIGWGRGTNEPDVNCFTVDEMPDEWEDGNSDTCEHDGEFTILDADEDSDD